MNQREVVEMIKDRGFDLIGEYGKWMDEGQTAWGKDEAERYIWDIANGVFQEKAVLNGLADVFVKGFVKEQISKRKNLKTIDSKGEFDFDAANAQLLSVDRGKYIVARHANAWQIIHKSEENHRNYEAVQASMEIYDEKMLPVAQYMIDNNIKTQGEALALMGL